MESWKYLSSVLPRAFANVPLWASDVLPIADTHVHYSHDSVELTPPEKVIEIMRSAQLKMALVSSSDDRGTQKLYELAPDLIIPGLRPYRKRGETGSWFTNPKALSYVESLLSKNRYASIGELHLYGADADLEIPRRIVELAVEHNLIVHAHSDVDAVERLLAQNNAVKVLWAHAGFESPEVVSQLLSEHDRLWVDLAFRSEVGSGGSLSEDWLTLLETHPTRLMLGTDTYTPERIYFIPEHAAAARTWLAELPAELQENIAWKNAYDLLMPIWKANRTALATAKSDNLALCKNAIENGGVVVNENPLTVLEPSKKIQVSEPFSVIVSMCAEVAENTLITLDATMPMHGHGMNYQPEHKKLSQTTSSIQVQADGMVLHMPGSWQWVVNIDSESSRKSFTHDFILQ